MAQVRAFLSTSMASAGQRLAQMLHRMHTAESLIDVPFEARGSRFHSTGYWMVSGFLNRDAEGHLPSLKLPYRLPFRAADAGVDGQDDHVDVGQVAPGSAMVMPARFWEVGVRMRMRSRYFVPLPRA